jgi:hypothetical protein
LKVFDDDEEASMSGSYDIIMAHFAEVRVYRLTQNVFPSPIMYGIQLGATDGTKKYDIFYSAIIWMLLSEKSR